MMNKRIVTKKNETSIIVLKNIIKLELYSERNMMIV